MSFIVKRLMEYTEEKRPDLFKEIMKKIQPHSLDAVLSVLECHLRKKDLNIFNQNMDAIPEFMWGIIKHFHFPEPGESYGILLACRTTKSDTQGALDSKHLSSLPESDTQFNVENNILHELALFSCQKQIFEFSNRRKYSTVYTNYSIRDLMKLLPEVGYLDRGFPKNKGKNLNGEFKYLSTFKYIVVKDRGSIKVLYQTLKDLYIMLRRISPKEIVAFSDVRNVFQKCGIVCHFFNMVNIAERQLFTNDGSAYEKDVLTLIKYQCRSGQPLPLTRDGLAKNPDRTPIDVLSFEAILKNFGKFSTGEYRNQWFNVTSSFDRMFIGEQFNTGVGFNQYKIYPSQEYNFKFIDDSSTKSLHIRESETESDDSDYEIY